ncbi:hypothetical protein GCM10009802_15120 [Streptomyces synnematoformans]|uniref:Uncharacterized protein n=1 Tax=Streptomyces synnematoformans TaxID=415721 RepID=A0ABN2XRK0_9ACTN
MQLRPDDLTDVSRCEACAPAPPAADGIPELIEAVVPVVAAFRTGNGPGDGPVTLAVGCADGRLSATPPASAGTAGGTVTQAPGTGPRAGRARRPHPGGGPGGGVGPGREVRGGRAGEGPPARQRAPVRGRCPR